MQASPNQTKNSSAILGHSCRPEKGYLGQAGADLGGPLFLAS
jgi:hypothetical protein